MTQPKEAPYEAWLKTIPDRSISAMWARNAAPSEGDWPNQRAMERAWMIHCEMQERGLLGGGLEA
jgi:hypothetical protein